ncbi:MAG: GAF domain-containing protein, partial [Anaerolineae bacterium]|nr:GAF domain-containing protein [Anaerolineae bacterium]
MSNGLSSSASLNGVARANENRLNRWSRTIVYVLVMAAVTIPRIILLVDQLPQITAISFFITLLFISYFPIAGFLTYLILAPRNHTKYPYLIILLVQIDLIFIAIINAGSGSIIALVIVLLTIFITFYENRDADSGLPIIGGIVTAIFASIINIYSPIEQLDIPTISIFMIGYLIAIVATYLLFVFNQIIFAPIRIKLMLLALVVSLLPIIVISSLQLRSTQENLQSQNFSGLTLAANQTTKNLDDFFDNALYNASLIASFDVFKEYLATQPHLPTNSIVERELITTMESITNIEQGIYLSSIAVLSKNGVAVYDTKAGVRVLNESEEDYFKVPLETGRPYISQLIFTQESRTPHIVISSPIFDSNRKVIGVIRIKYLGTVLQKILDDNKFLFGDRSYPMLLSEDGIRIADAVSPLYMYSPAYPLTQAEINTLIDKKRLSNQYFANVDMPDLAELINQDNPPVTAEVDILEMNPGLPEAVAISTMQARPWTLIYVQDQEELFGLIAEQRREYILFSTIIAGIAGLASFAGASAFSNPISRLTKAADKISSGDLAERVSIQTNDELTYLASSFNMMTNQLRGFINELEDRVKARTEELAQQNELLNFRANQLQTIAEVAQGITAASDLNLLLSKITQLVSDRFDFYHVGIFLIDDRKEYAVLRASNSPGGQKMLARNHKLKVGQVGIVGYVTGEGAPRIASDVGQDAVYFNNPDLPETRSEMALPLKTGDNVIGALDVQSTSSSAFSENDVELFSILADQISIAILNSRLYEETNQALSEMQELHRQYLRQEWGTEVAERRVEGYKYSSTGISPIQGNTIIADDDVFEIGKPLIKRGETTNTGEVTPDTLSVPILLRGEAIGLITVEEQPGSNR